MRNRVSAAGARRRLSVTPAGAHGVGQRDQGAVAPQSLEGVERTLLLVLDVYDDLGVVEEHPPAVPLTLTPYRLGAQLAELVLDLVDDRAHLPVVGGRAEHERVGDHQLLGDVEGDDVLRQLVRGRLGGGAHEVEGTVGCGHAGPSFETGWSGT